jgi:hypothetical protein
MEHGDVTSKSNAACPRPEHAGAGLLPGKRKIRLSLAQRPRLAILEPSRCG